MVTELTSPSSLLFDLGYYLPLVVFPVAACLSVVLRASLVSSLEEDEDELESTSSSSSEPLPAVFPAVSPLPTDEFALSSPPFKALIFFYSLSFCFLSFLFLRSIDNDGM